MSRIVITTAHFNDIVSRSLSEAITIAIRREDRGSPLFDRSPDLLQKDIFSLQTCSSEYKTGVVHQWTC
jgi:hypothetical protein